MAAGPELEKYEGLFAGARIGGMPTLKLNIIGEELNFLENGCRPLPASRIAPGPRVKSPMTRARVDAADKRAKRRPGTSMGFVERIRGTVSKEDAFRRSGLDTDATRERLFGTVHSGRTQDRFRTTTSDHFQFFKGADEISLFATMRKTQAETKGGGVPCLVPPTSLGMTRVDTARERQSKFRSKKCDPFDKCPKWSTTSGNFKAWDLGQNTNYRRIKPIYKR